RLGLIQLRIAGGKHAVPEQGDLFLQGPPRIDHAIQPVGLTAIDEHQAVLVHVIAPDEIFVSESRWSVLRAQQLLYRRLIPLSYVAFQFFSGSAKTGSTWQVSHQRDV